MQVTSEKKVIDLFQGIISCRSCDLSEGYLPQLRPPSVNYRSGGIVFVQINPGHIGNLTRDQIQKSYKKEHAQAIAFKKVDTSMRLQALQDQFQKDASLRNLHDLRDETYTAMREVWGWPPGKYGKTIESHGVDLDSVMVVNLAHCPIPADRYTTRHLSSCWKKWTRELIKILNPSILVAQGKTAYCFLEKQDLPAGIKVLEGVHHASRMRKEERDDMLKRVNRRITCR